jgi:RND family efflux transporter MFP subunit
MNCLPLLTLLMTSAALPPQGDAGKAKVVLEARGHLVPVRTVTVGTLALGRVVEAPFEEGKLVKAGDVLVRLEANQQVAELDRVQAQLVHSKALLDRLQKIAAQGLGAVSADELMRVRADVGANEASVKLAQARLEQMTILAPFDGTILIKRIEIGSVVNTAFAGQGDICELADLSAMEVDLWIPEKDMERVQVGQVCTIRLDAAAKAVFQGKVSRVLPVADLAKGAVGVRVRFAVPAEARGHVRVHGGAAVSFLGKE